MGKNLSVQMILSGVAQPDLTHDRARRNRLQAI